MGASRFSSVLLVKYNGTTVGNFSIMNFTGTGVSVADAGGGQVNVTINIPTGVFWKLNGNTEGAEKYIGTTDNFDFPIYTNGTRKMTVKNGTTPKVGIGVSSPATTLDLVSDNTSGDVDVVSLRSTGTGITPASQTGVKFYSWVNSFQNNSCARIYATFDSINVYDGRLTLQSIDAGGAFDNTLNLQNKKVGVGSTRVNPLSNLDIGGSLGLTYIAKTANYTATIDDCTINATSGTFTITLPTAVGINGRVYNIKNSGSGVVTLAGTSAQTFDGTASPTLAQYDSVIIQSNGANWIVLSRKIASSSAFYSHPFSGIMNNYTIASVLFNGIAAGWNDIYTVPSGKKAMLLNVQIMNGSGGSLVYYAGAKISGTYRRISGNQSVVTTNFTNGANNFLFNAGEIFAYNCTGGTSTIYGTIIEFDDTSPITRAGAWGSIVNGDNIIFTATKKTQILVGSNVAPQVPTLYTPKDATAPTIDVYMAPSGASTTGAQYRLLNTSSGGTNSVGVVTVGGMLDIGGFINLKSNATNTDIGWWFNYVEFN